MALKNQFIRSIAFSKNRETEVAVVDYIKERELNFVEETKKMWFDRVGISPESIPKSFTKVLELELKNKESSNLDKAEVLEKIAKYFENVEFEGISQLIRELNDKESDNG